MSAPSRRPEIRRRRTRKHKTAKLRMQYSAAKSDADRSRITNKARRMNPAFKMEEFLAQTEHKKDR